MEKQVTRKRFPWRRTSGVTPVCTSHDWQSVRPVTREPVGQDLLGRVHDARERGCPAVHAESLYVVVQLTQVRPEQSPHPPLGQRAALPILQMIQPATSTATSSPGGGRV
jgi:hypothetical protein